MRTSLKDPMVPKESLAANTPSAAVSFGKDERSLNVTKQTLNKVGSIQLSCHQRRSNKNMTYE